MSSKFNNPPIGEGTAEPIYQEAQGYLAAIIQSADDPIISKDLNGIITSWNPAAERVFGFSAEEMVGKPILTFIPEDRVAEEKMILQRVRRDEAIDHLETVRLRKDGSRIEISLTVSPVKDSKGRIIGASKIARDISGISARMRQQQAVAELGQVALLEDDLQRLCDRATATVARVLDLPFSKVLQILPDQGGQLLLKSGVGWKEGFVGKATIPSGEGSQSGLALMLKGPVVVDDLRSESRFEHPDLLVEHEIVSGVTCIIVGENNRPWGALGVHTQTVRKFTDDDIAFLQAVANVLASCVQREATKERFRLAFEAAPNGMVMVDEAGSIQMVNSQMEQLFGYSREELHGQPIEKLIPESFRGDQVKIRYVFGERPEIRKMGHGHDLFGRRKDGTAFPVEVGFNPAETTEGRFILAAVIDISQRKQMETELAEAHAKLGERASQLEEMVAQRTDHLRQTIEELESVSYSLSHDMRAPLRTIHSFSQILLEEADETLNADQKGLLEKIINSAARLDRLIRDILVYSRVSREAITLEPIDLESLLNQIIVERPEFQPPKAKVKLDLPLATVSAHEAYLTQCITNLLDNAVKFVPADRTPEVNIWTESRDGKVCFYFQDNGPGIPEEARDRIFGIFQQIHADDTFSGTGIGLAIVRRAVERMGGSVHIESAPNQGARICLELSASKS